MGCGTSKEAVVSSDGSGRCSRKLFRRKSSVVATGAHQPVATAAKDNGDAVKHHKAASAPPKAVFKSGDEVASTVIGAKVVGEKKDKEKIKKDGKEELVAVAAGDAKGKKETASEKIAGDKKGEETKKADGVSDKEVVADQQGDESVVVVEEIKNGEAAVRDERRGKEEEEVWSAEAIDNEGASSTEKDIEGIAMEVGDDGGVTFTDATVGVATVEEDGVVVSADAPATEEDEVAPYAPSTVAGDDGGIDVVASPVTKQDELVSFASAPLAEEVDGIILPAAPVVEEVSVAAFTAAPVANEGQTAAFADTPVAKENASVASIDAPVTKEDESVTVAAAPVVTEDEGATTIDSAALTTTANEDETVTSSVAPVNIVDESLTLPAAALVSEEAEAEQPTPSGNDDDWRNDQELQEPTALGDVASEADDETEQAKDAAEAEVVTVEEANAEPEEAESVSREAEEETSAAVSNNDDGESDGKQAVDLDDAVNTEVKGGEDQLTVEENKEEGEEEPIVAPVESPSS